MPKILIHAPARAYDAIARRTIAGELTDFALDCEALPKSPFVKSTVWIYFNAYADDEVFMGDRPATLDVVSAQIFVIEGGLDADAKKRLIKGVTEIIARPLAPSDRPPVYIVIQEIPEIAWGIFGHNADLAALRASSASASAL